MKKYQQNAEREVRIGEILGFRWKQVHIDEEDYHNEMLRLDIECELQRVNRDVLEKYFVILSEGR